MVSADAIRTVVGIMGNFTALTLFLSPVKTFVRIWKKGSVEQYSPVPYLATLFNCMAWALYGFPMVHPHSILLLTINSTAVFIELSFIILFLIYTPDKKQRLKVLLVLLLELVFMVILAFLVFKLAQTYSTRSLIVGLVCVPGTILMYASPLSVMKLVITTKSVEYMPFLLSLFTFLNSIAWFTYAQLRFDIFLTVTISNSNFTYDSEWVGLTFRISPAASLCYILQEHKETDGRKESQTIVFDRGGFRHR